MSNAAQSRRLISRTGSIAGLGIGVLLALSACAHRKSESFDSPSAEALLREATAAIAQPSSPDASRKLEERIVGVLMKGMPKEAQGEFREMLEPTDVLTYSTKFELAPNAPDTKEMRQRLALMNALWDLRSARNLAERKAKGMRID